MSNDQRSPARPDWRDAEQYRHLLDLDRAGWAWEWLRRHAEYRDDYQDTPPEGAGGASQDQLIIIPRTDQQAVASLWGLCFRRIAQLPRDSGAAALGCAV
jgi:hypothetical protein